MTAAAAAPSRRCRRALALALLVTPWALSAAQPASPGLDAAGPMDRYAGIAAGGARNAPQVQLAAIVVNGVERPDPLAVITSPEGTLVALDYVVAALHLAVQAEADAYRIATPLGEARIPTDALREVQGYSFIDLPTLARSLGAELHFDPGEYALRVNLGWDPYAATSQAGTAAQTQTPPDVAAPRASLSRWRSELAYRRDDGGDGWQSLTDLGGALGPGAWRLRYLDDFAGSRRLDTWSWTAGRGNTRLLLGRELVNLNGVLSGFYLTGAQAAWSNRPRALFDAGYGDTLVASRLDTPRSVRGKGPPGGIAELRRDGQVLARLPIALDGSYEFRDLALNGGRLEVAVYERGQPDVPVRVDEIRVQASDQLLAKGAVLHYAGIGTTDNPLDPQHPGGERAGFYQWRQGLSEGLTVNAAVQAVGDRRQAAAGAVVNLGGLGVWAGTLAEGEHGQAVQVLGDGGRGPLFWRAALRHEDAGYTDAGSPRREDAYAELGRDWAQNLSLSLVGRRQRGGQDGDVSFVKPALTWQPRSNLALNARPDSDGRYIYAAAWGPRPDLRLNLSRYRDRTQLEATERLPGDYALRGQLADDSQLGRRGAVYLDAQRLGRLPVGWTVGALRSGSHSGYLVEASGELRPGLTLRAQMLSDPLLRGQPADPGRQFLLAVVADFAVTPSGLARGGFRSDRQDRGGISGRIVVGEGLDAARLAGAGVLLDGQLRGSVDARGRFLLDDVPSGVYALALDSEKLPLEYQPSDPVRRVQVRAGAVTRLDFAIALRLGFAGRVSGPDGAGRAELALEVHDAEGKRVAQGRSDAWGYYRFDGLPPGRYRVQSADGAVQREVVLERSFVFDVNLSVRSAP